MLLSQFNLCPGITIATDDVITTTDDIIPATDDVITTTNDVIHIIYIDLEGKIMSCKKVASRFSTSNLFSGITCGNIDATVITQQQKNMLLVKVSLYQKFIQLKTVSWLRYCKMGTPRMNLFYLYQLNENCRKFTN